MSEEQNERLKLVASEMGDRFRDTCEHLEKARSALVELMDMMEAHTEPGLHTATLETAAEAFVDTLNLLRIHHAVAGLGVTPKNRGK